MPTGPRLPDRLRYLEPFARALRKLTPDDAIEEVDPAPLAAALRKRLRGLADAAVAAELTADRRLLEAWRTTEAAGESPAYALLDHFLRPDVAVDLIRAFATRPRGPTITFDPPVGWKAKPAHSRLDLRAGRLIACLMAIDRPSFDGLKIQAEFLSTPPGSRATRHASGVNFGDVSGAKSLFIQAEPVPWRRVDYLLIVPGGLVSATLDAMGGNFDETPFEARLHTLRIDAPTPAAPDRRS